MALFTFHEAFVGKIMHDILDFIIIRFHFIVYIGLESGPCNTPAHHGVLDLALQSL